MTAPTVLMEMYLAGSWVDITAYVHLPSGISVTRGRDNEQGSPNPGTLSFTVKADGGRFIVGNSAAPAPFNAFARWAPVRYSINGLRRFTGYVSSAPASWRSSQLSQVPIVCTDLLGMMAMSVAVDSWAHELIEDLAPLYWWPLDDTEGSTTATAAAGGVPLTPSLYLGAGSDHILSDAVAFGATADATQLAGGSGVGALEADSQLKLVTDWPRMVARMGAADLAVPATFTAIWIYTPADPPADPASVALTFKLTINGRPVRVFLDADNTIWVEDGDPDEATDFQNSTVPTNHRRAGQTTTFALTITPTTGTLRVDGESVSWSVARAFTAASVTVGHRDGLYCHAALLSGAISDATWADLRLKILGQGLGTALGWLKRACTAAGVATDPVATMDRPMERPALKGSNPAAIAETLASSAAAMCVASRDGVLTWIDWTYCPAVVDLVEPLTSDAKWDADPSLYYTDVQVNGTTRASSPTNAFPKRAREVPGLLPETDQQSLVAWLANTADIWGAPRASGLVVNLWPLSAARTAAYLGLDLRSRVRLTTLPQGMPTPMVATVEGYTETVTESVWIMQLQTAPDPSLVWEDDITTWESDYRINPF